MIKNQDETMAAIMAEVLAEKKEFEEHPIFGRLYFFLCHPDYLEDNRLFFEKAEQGEIIYEKCHENPRIVEYYDMLNADGERMPIGEIFQILGWTEITWEESWLEVPHETVLGLLKSRGLQIEETVVC